MQRLRSVRMSRKTILALALTALLAQTVAFSGARNVFAQQVLPTIQQVLVVNDAENPVPVTVEGSDAVSVALEDPDVFVTNGVDEPVPVTLEGPDPVPMSSTVVSEGFALGYSSELSDPRLDIQRDPVNVSLVMITDVEGNIVIQLLETTRPWLRVTEDTVLPLTQRIPVNRVIIECFDHEEEPCRATVQVVGD